MTSDVPVKNACQTREDPVAKCARPPSKGRGSAVPGWTFKRICGLFQFAMNTLLVKFAPQGDFVEISALMRGWETRFQTLVSQRRPIKYDMYPLPDIPQEFQNRLKQEGYSDLIIENDRWQHFLVPTPK